MDEDVNSEIWRSHLIWCKQYWGEGGVGHWNGTVYSLICPLTWLAFRHHRDCDCKIAKSGLHSFLVDWYCKMGQFEISILFEIKVPLNRKACAILRMVTFSKSFWHLCISNSTPDYDDHLWALYFVSLLHYLEKCKIHKKWILPMHGKVPLLHSKLTQPFLFLFQNILPLSLKCWTWSEAVTGGRGHQGHGPPKS